MYNILILGGGGREHTLAWKISKSRKCGKLYTAPGNAGTGDAGTNLALDILDFNAVEQIVDKYEIDFLVVGPEAPLVGGIYDHFKNHKVSVIGPSAAASSLEGSKDFANAFMSEFGIPTAGYKTITRANKKEGYEFIDKQPGNIVLKADGLAAGKGVIIVDDKAEAKAVLDEMLEGKFGDASAKVVLEEFLDGTEFSVFVATDGRSYTMLPVAKDYKRIGEKDTGLNTGGMGAISPVPFADKALMDKVKTRIIEPTLHGIREKNYEYKGFIFFGLINVDNDPYVIEYNCRLGDPETEVVLPRVKSDLVDIFEAIRDKQVDRLEIEIDNRSAATIMLVSGGYPRSYEKNKTIYINKDKCRESILFHAGTKNEDGELKTNGGRVIAVTSLAPDYKKALGLSMASIEGITFDGMYFRNDIGFDLE